MKVQDNIEPCLIRILDCLIEELKKELLVSRINPIREWETHCIHMPLLAHLVKNGTIERSGHSILQTSGIFPGIVICKRCFNLRALEYQRMP